MTQRPGRLVPMTLALVAPLFLAGRALAVSGEALILDHVHFGVPDSDRTVAAQWYMKYMGAQPGPAGEPKFDRVLFGSTRFVFMKTDKPLPSAGSAIDHVAISFPDLDAKMKELQAAGIKIVTPIHEEPGLFRCAFIEDAWGARIEVLQDPARLGLHHVHLISSDPKATLNWYLDMIGGERTRLKGLDGVKYGDVLLLVQKGNPLPGEGYVIDHLGFGTTDLGAKIAQLKAHDVKFLTGAVHHRDVHFADVVGPESLRIRVAQRPATPDPSQEASRN
jgi:predicted enzyme related to lactoylglutathione lyase/catechol 2,3-dioxygenase-like lactoylglutathione lyase family enzyme